MVHFQSRFSLGCQRNRLSLTAPSPLWKNCGRFHTVDRLSGCGRSRPRYFDSIRCSIRSGKISVFKN